MIFLLLATFATYGQKCDDLVRWQRSVAAEFPEVDHNRIISGTTTFKHIRFSLLSDRFFVPVFGEPFDKMSRGARSKIGRRLSGCRQEISGHDIGQPEFYLSGVFSNENAYNEAVNEIREIRMVRQDAEEMTRKIVASEISFGELEKFGQSIDRQFRMLVASERTQLKKVAEENMERMGNKELSSKIAYIKNLPIDDRTLKAIDDFRIENVSAFHRASYELRAVVDSIFELKTDQAIHRLAVMKTREISSLDFPKEGIQKVNRLWEEMQRTFGNHIETPAVQSLLAAYKKGKSALVRDQSQHLQGEIKKEKSKDKLSELSTLYLSNVDSTAEVRNISLAIDKRKDQIEKERLAAEDRRKTLETTTLKFSLEGVQNLDIIRDIYRGDFSRIPFDRRDAKFSYLLNGYILAHSETCAASLPKNKIELTKEECAEEMVTRNGWGIEVSRYCVKWRTVRTGSYTTPELHAAMKLIASFQAEDFFSNVIEMMKNTDAATRTFYSAVSIKKDTERFLKQNKCDSKGLKRFQDNLLRYAAGEKPIILGEE